MNLVTHMRMYALQRLQPFRQDELTRGSGHKVPCRRDTANGGDERTHIRRRISPATRARPLASDRTGAGFLRLSLEIVGHSAVCTSPGKRHAKVDRLLDRSYKAAAAIRRSADAQGAARLCPTGHGLTEHKDGRAAMTSPVHGCCPCHNLPAQWASCPCHNLPAQALFGSRVLVGIIPTKPQIPTHF
jgi:hypothetical protein